jgi:hypothetical protein
LEYFSGGLYISAPSPPASSGLQAKALALQLGIRICDLQVQDPRLSQAARLWQLQLLQRTLDLLQDTKNRPAIIESESSGVASIHHILRNLNFTTHHCAKLSILSILLQVFVFLSLCCDL